MVRGQSTAFDAVHARFAPFRVVPCSPPSQPVKSRVDFCELRRGTRGRSKRTSLPPPSGRAYLRASGRVMAEHHGTRRKPTPLPGANFRRSAAPLGAASNSRKLTDSARARVRPLRRGEEMCGGHLLARVARDASPAPHFLPHDPPSHRCGGLVSADQREAETNLLRAAAAARVVQPLLRGSIGVSLGTLVQCPPDTSPSVCGNTR